MLIFLHGSEVYFGLYVELQLSLVWFTVQTLVWASALTGLNANPVSIYLKQSRKIIGVSSTNLCPNTLEK